MKAFLSLSGPQNGHDCDKTQILISQKEQENTAKHLSFTLGSEFPFLSKLLSINIAKRKVIVQSKLLSELRLCV